MNKIYLSILLLCLGLNFRVQAQTASVFDFLLEQGVRDVTIEADLSYLLSTIDSLETEVEGTLRFKDQDGVERTLALDLSARGRFRLKTCDFPPLMLNFSKKELKAMGLTAPEYDKLKLVTHCLEERYVSKEIVAKEALAYEIARVLTPFSYRTQLLRIRYVDRNGTFSTERRIGLLLEDTDEMAARMGGKECEDCLNPSPEMLDPVAENMHAWFQYLIGNVDFSLSTNQNLKVVVRENGMLVPVPYDFDFSGLVSAPYARANGSLGQTSVRDRIFIGQLATDAVMTHNIRQLGLKRADLESVVKQAPYLSTHAKENTLQYLKEFYATLESLVLEGKGDYYQRLRARYAEVLPIGATPQYFGLSK